MNPFEQYLEHCHLDPVRLSMEAKVRNLTVYNAKKVNYNISVHELPHVLIAHNMQTTKLIGSAYEYIAAFMLVLFPLR